MIIALFGVINIFSSNNIHKEKNGRRQFLGINAMSKKWSKCLQKRGSGKKEAGNFEAEKKGLISRLYKIMRYKPHEI